MNSSVCAGFIDKGQLYMTHCWIRFTLAVKNFHYKFFPQKHHLIVVNTILNTNMITLPFVLFAEILQYIYVSLIMKDKSKTQVSVHRTLKIIEKCYLVVVC